MNMQLIPFTKAHAQILVNWIPTEEFNYLWGGSAYFWPLDANQIEHHISQPEVFPYLMLLDGEPAGFIELIKKRKRLYRICRVLLADSSQRGKGLGAQMMRLIMDVAADKFGVVEFELAVFEHNEPAIQCYKNLGFSTASIKPITTDKEGMDGWVRHKMKLKVVK